MGYRSDVGIEMRKNAFDEFKKEVLDVIPDFYPDHIYKNDDSYIIIWDWVKWYEDYEEVQKIEEFLNILGTCAYYFIRIGEDIEDVEVRGSSQNYLSLGLSIYNQNTFTELE